MSEALPPGVAIWHDQLGPGTLVQHYPENGKLKVAFWFYAPKMIVSEDFARVSILDPDVKEHIHALMQDCLRMSIHRFQTECPEGYQKELNLRSGAQ